MTYTEAEQFLLSLGNFRRKEYMADPRACEWYLKRLQFFLDLLGNPERHIPHYIHVTGTSGKGSVTTFLHSVLHSAGKRVGSITSPHPTYTFERWLIGNRSMNKKEFVRLIEKIKPVLDEYVQKNPYDMMSYSELMFAIGLLYGAEQRVDWMVVEVGCGGRYDATNIIPNKDVAVITNVGMDHMHILGNTKEKIAYEKAGIIIKGSTVFSAEKNKKVLAVIDAECKKRRVKRIPFAPHVSHVLGTSAGTTFQYHEEPYALSVIGKHQINNAVLVIDIAKHLGIPVKKIQQGLRQTVQPARMEVVSHNPTIILDGAHNHDKIKTTVATIQTLFPNQKLHLIVGFAENKQWNVMIRQLSALAPKSIAITHSVKNPFRKFANLKDIQTQCAKHLKKVPTKLFLDSRDAFLWAKRNAQKNGLVLVTGSLFISGELRPLIRPFAK